MKKFQPAYTPEHEVRAAIEDMLSKWLAGDTELCGVFAAADESAARAAITSHVTELYLNDEIYLNDVYQVNVRRYPNEVPGKPDLVHLSIKRIDRQCIHDWRDLQEIKNQLVGPECEGVELYPAESRLVDTANQYHIWCINDPTFRFGFGFNERLVSAGSIHKSVNRPFKK